MITKLGFLILYIYTLYETYKLDAISVMLELTSMRKLEQ